MATPIRSNDNRANKEGHQLCDSHDDQDFFEHRKEEETLEQPNNKEYKD